MTAAPSKGHPEHDAWSCSVEALLQSLSVDPERGLDSNEVVTRRRTWGRNQLNAVPKRRGLSILVAQFKSIVVALLLVAGALALLFSEIAEGIAIFAVVLINAAMGFLTEWRAVRSMEALRAFARVECAVLRGGTAEKVPAEDLVPGDIVLVEAGDLVPADLRLIETAKLTANESTLTGESLPVGKQTSAIRQEASLLERDNLAFKGTTIARGSGRGVVTGTARNTEFGKIFEQVTEAEAPPTPLEKRLNSLGSGLAWAIIGLAVVIALVGILAGRDLYLAIEVAIALSVAAIPEGLAIVATIALARGMWRLAKRNALITRLSAVETLGATSTILTDKTGTLTENEMAVSTVLLADVDVDFDAASGAACAGGTALQAGHTRMLHDLLKAGARCNNASFEPAADDHGRCVGDPTECALLTAASVADIWRRKLLESAPEIREDPFDPDSKRMATLHRQDGRVLVAVKGAPETVIPGCDAMQCDDGTTPVGEKEREQWLARAAALGERGLRTLAIAEKTSDDESVDPYDQLVLLGIVGMEDPARDGVSEAVQQCQDAGISVVMMTGDHAATARNVALETGIVTASDGQESYLDGAEVDLYLSDDREQELLAVRVFSRVTPEQKLQLIDLYQQCGQVVAMTGDGVNDAPALKKADIGIAMGLRGTAVAREAAVMVLQDDEFSTIVAAVAHGRAIFANIRKFVVYLLSCNMSEVLVVSLATIAGAPLPLLPLQILFLNLVTDVFPALALGVGEGSPILMQQRPRFAKERILTRSHWLQIGLHGAIMAITVLAAMAVSIHFLNFNYREAVTVAFCTLAFAQMWHVFNMRDEIRRFLHNEITQNKWIWVALLVCLVLVLVAIYVPVLSDVLVLADPGPRGWGLILSASIVPLIMAPLVNAVMGFVQNRQLALSST